MELHALRYENLQTWRIGLNMRTENTVVRVFEKIRSPGSKDYNVQPFRINGLEADS